MDINVFISLVFFLYQLRIGTKSAFEFHNYRSEQISLISSNFNYFMSTYISNFHRYILNLLLCFTNIYFPFYFQFLFFTTKKKNNKVCFFLIITDCTCKITSTCSILYYPYLGLCHTINPDHEANVQLTYT